MVFFRFFFFPCKSCNPAARERLGNLHWSKRDFGWIQDHTWGFYCRIGVNMLQSKRTIGKVIWIIPATISSLKYIQNLKRHWKSVLQLLKFKRLQNRKMRVCIYTHKHARTKIYESCKDHWNSLRTPLQPWRGARSFFITLPPHLGGLLIISKMISPLHALFHPTAKVGLTPRALILLTDS